MISLTDGMILYHGSYTEVSQIQLEKCSKGKDFGQGFYLTSSHSQAEKFIRLSCKKQIRLKNISEDTESGYISVYKLHLSEKMSFKLFESADKEWLHFVAANRDIGLFSDILNQYKKTDIIGGKIANDRTARTLNAYIDGLFGEPGMKQADDFAIQTLMPNRLEDQYCFRTEAAIAALEFIGSEYHV